MKLCWGRQELVVSTLSSTGETIFAPHPQNHGFAWTPVRGPFRAITDEQARSFNDRGFFVLENAIDRATVMRARDAIDPFEVKAEEFLRSRPDGRMGIAQADGITFTVHLVRPSQVLREFSPTRIFQALCHAPLAP